MGGHAGFALGLALARPDKRVVLFDSEGDILMSLGMLVTIAEQQPANFYHFLIDNGCYATTGGQPVPNADNVAYDVIARGAGYPRAFAFDELDQFSSNLPDILENPGPVFVALKVVPELENAPIGRRRRWQTRTRSGDRGSANRTRCRWMISGGEPARQFLAQCPGTHAPYRLRCLPTQ